MSSQIIFNFVEGVELDLGSGPFLVESDEHLGNSENLGLLIALPYRLCQIGAFPVHRNRDLDSHRASKMGKRAGCDYVAAH